MRGRNRNNGNKGPNPLTKSYESNGPDVKIRGTAQHIAEKYSQLARDAQASGDPVAAENYFQHAEHYYRIIAAAQEQLREQYGYQQRFDEEGDEEGFAQGERPSFERAGAGNGEDMDFGSQPQPYETRGEGEQRPSRFDRGDRPERGERQDRGDRQDRRDRFQRDRGPRQDFQREDQPFEGRGGEGEQRPSRFERGDRPERGERQDRPERGERRERFQRDRRRDETNTSDTGGLPAFLTNPVRSAPAPVEDQGPAAPTLDFGAEPAAEERPRRRTRRTRRDVVESAGDEAASFTPDVETPAAE